MKKIYITYLFLLISCYASAQAGSPDNSFGTSGKVVVPVGSLGDVAYATARQTDGKIIAAGYSAVSGRYDFSVIRLNSDGSLDNSFDGDGKAIITLGTYGSICYAASIQTDGKILLAGIAVNDDYDFAVVRLNSNGSPDNTFSGDGIAVITVSDPFFNDECYAIAVQTDGKILLAGYATYAPNNSFQDFAVVRLNTDGSLDNSFAGDGHDVYPVSQFGDKAYGITVQTDGKIVVAGQTFVNNYDIGVIRLNSDGSEDNSFDSDGYAYISNGFRDECRAVAIQTDGKILLAGRLRHPDGDGPYDFTVNRLNTDGSPDNSFDSDGAVIIQVGSGDDLGTSMALQSDGKIIVAGYSDMGNFNNDVSAIRLQNTGSLDSCFDGDGKLILSSTANEYANAVALQPDGKIILAGATGSSQSEDFVVFRLLGTCGPCPDQDSDGYSTCQNDCNDNNPNIHPGATEVCNGIDDNCNGQIDEGVQLTFYRDNDADGYGNPSITIQACSAPTGYVNNNTDCNDNNAAVHPGATEVCNGIDDNCNGQIDEGVLLTFYRDNDADGYGNPSITIQACFAPAGYVNNNTDCNDNNAAIHPGATEVCNGIDDNCNGQIDEGVLLTFYRDNDADGYGNSAISTQACSAPAGYVNNNTDCNDNNASIHPGAAEVCNGIDDNCNGQIDEGLTLITFYRDADGDGYGKASVSVQACSQPPGYVSDNTDCNDSNPNIHPGATEVCNGVDDNCNGQVDEGLPLNTYYRDNDGDGYGNAAITIQVCAAQPPAGYVNNNTDCNDNNAAIHPGAIEICNGIDDDCDGLIDEGVQITFYRDADDDSYGNPAISIQSCYPIPQGYVANNLDCNDANLLIHPGATEICNGIDDDCDGLIDEGATQTFYRDLDGDGYGNPNQTIQAPCGAPPQGYVTNSLDCNDGNANVNPGATEICNGIDDNCNGQIDEGSQHLFFRDNDGDGFGDPSQYIQAPCNPPPQGYVTNAMDCDDANANVHPGALEICNGIDDDCDEVVDDGCVSPYIGGIADGHGTNQLINTVFGPPNHFFVYFGGSGDGHDSAQLINQIFGPPNHFFIYFGGSGDGHDSAQLINQIFGPPPHFFAYFGGGGDGWAMKQNECVIGTYYRDADGDGYGNPNITTLACAAPAGYVNNNTDCNDNNAAIHPGAIEICGNNIDDNCNGQTDENTMVANITPGGTASACLGTPLILSANTGTGFSYQWYRNNLIIAGQTAPTLSVTQPGNYTVRVTNSGNCMATSAATVVNLVNPPAAGITIQGNGNNCPVNMLAHPGGPTVTYQWNKNGVPVAGATARNYSATTSGSYTVTVTKDGCTKTSAAVVITSCPQNAASQEITSIENADDEPLTNQSVFKLYPNPASNNFTIALNLHNGSSGEAIIQITTLSGSIVMTQKATVIKGRMWKNIPLNNKWTDNIYIVKVIINKKIFISKLAKINP